MTETLKVETLKYQIVYDSYSGAGMQVISNQIASRPVHKSCTAHDRVRR